MWPASGVTRCHFYCTYYWQMTQDQPSLKGRGLHTREWVPGSILHRGHLGNWLPLWRNEYMWSVLGRCPGTDFFEGTSHPLLIWSFIACEASRPRAGLDFYLIDMETVAHWNLLTRSHTASKRGYELWCSEAPPAESNQGEVIMDLNAKEKDIIVRVLKHDNTYCNSWCRDEHIAPICSIIWYISGYTIDAKARVLQNLWPRNFTCRKFS